MNKISTYMLFLALGVLLLSGVAHAAYVPVYITGYLINNTPAAGNFLVGASIPITVQTNIGGSGTYIYNWSVANPVSCPGVNLPNNYTTTETTNTLIYTPTLPTSNCIFVTYVYDANAVANVQSIGGNVMDLSSENFTSDATSDLGNIVAYLPLSVTLSPSSALNLPVGLSTPITATVNGGLAPFTYDFTVFNSTSGNMVYNALYTDVASNTSTLIFTATSNMVGNALEANVVVTDSEAPQNVMTANSAIITITPAIPPLSSVALLESNSTADVGQVVTLSAQPTGGSNSFTYNFYNKTGSTQILGCSNTSSTCTFIADSTGTFNYNVSVTDTQASITVNSVANTVTVNAAPSVSILGNVAPIGFSANTATDNITTPTQATLSLPTAQSLYICAGGAGNDWLQQVSWSLQNTTAQDSNINPTSGDFNGASGELGGFSSIGNQISNNCEVTTTVGGIPLALAGISLDNTSGYTLTIAANATSNALYPNGIAAQSLTYTVPSGPPSTVVIAMASGWEPETSYSIPSSCVVNSTSGSDDSEFALVAICRNQAPGTYTINEVLQDVSGMSEAAYIFTPSSNPLASTVSSGTPVTVNAVATGSPDSFTFEWFVNGAAVTGQDLTANTASLTYTPSASGTAYNINVIALDQGTTVPFAISSTDNYTITTTVTSGGGGGGGSGNTGGGGGANIGGSGGSSLPVVTNTTNGFTVNNLAQLGNVNLVFCGQIVKVTDNYISPNSTGVTVGTNQYALTVGTPQQLANLGSSCYIELTNVSYLPILQTVTLQLYNASAVNKTSALKSLLANGISLNISSIGTISNAQPASLAPLITVKDATNSTPAAPTNFTKIEALNISVTSLINSTTLAVTASVKCGYPNVVPFILDHGIWKTVTPSTYNAAACTVTFVIPADPVIAFMTPSAPAKQQEPPASSIVATTVPTTTVQSTIAAATAAASSSHVSIKLIFAFLALIVVIVAAIVLLSSSSPKKKRRRNYN